MANGTKTRWSRHPKGRALRGMCHEAVRYGRPSSTTSLTAIAITFAVYCAPAGAMSEVSAQKYPPHLEQQCAENVRSISRGRQVRSSVDRT